MLSENFTQRLNFAMKQQNLRQVDLRKKTKAIMKKYIKNYNGDGIDKTLLNKYIKGVAFAKQDNIFILAKALNVSEAWLMGFDVAMERNDDTDEKHLKNNKITSFSTKNGVKISIETDKQITAEDVLEALDCLKEIQTGDIDKTQQEK